MKQKTKQIKQKLVLIGSGMVGARFLERLLIEAPKQFDIRVFNKEPHGGYNRIMLSSVLAGEMALPDIMTHNQDWFTKNDIHLHTNTEIVAIDQKYKMVFTQLGDAYSYDKLIIATGSTPFMIPVEGTDLPGLVSFRDVRDVNFMINAANNNNNQNSNQNSNQAVTQKTASKAKAVVIGGGLLGLEAANGLIKRGMDVTVVHRSDILMNVQMDKVSGLLLKNHLEANGMHFKMSAQTSKILGTHSVTGVQFADGSQLNADLVVMAVGIRPNIGVAKKLGLATKQGILVNDQLQTSAPDIYALGECVEHRDQLYGLVAPLYEQAQVLAETLAGKSAQYQGSFISTKLKVTGINLFSAGDFHDSKETESLVYQDLTLNIYRKIVLKNNQIQGVILYGDVSSANWLFEQLVKQNDMAAYRETLVFGEGFAPLTIKNTQKEKVA